MEDLCNKNIAHHCYGFEQIITMAENAGEIVPDAVRQFCLNVGTVTEEDLKWARQIILSDLDKKRK